MKAFRILLHSVILTILVLIIVYSQIDASGLLGKLAGQAEQERILSATLQIRVYPCIGYYYEQGLATLIAYAGEKLILTHNHWNILDSFCKAQLRDAQGEFLMDLPQQKFLALIQYQDAGSLVLRVPQGLDRPAVDFNGQAGPHANDAILVVHQDPQDADRVAVIAGQVQALNLQGAIPTYTISTPGSEAIIKGDSGGGVWYAGKLAGNLWAYYKDQPQAQPGEPQMQMSIVAQIPLAGIQTRPATSQVISTPEPSGRFSNVVSEDVEALP
jgi:hypothetical protein